VSAVQQAAIKRILAYSTLSQLGFMVMGVGLAGPGEAMFHLTTHAFFKALLFLGAGSVIVALHHEQDIWKMGALRRRMPVTFWTFTAGALALAGIWPLSGFFSKDSILAQALEVPVPHLRYSLFTVGVIVAALTAFYMTRLLVVVFFGTRRAEQAHDVHESPGVMVWPLRILAVFTLIGGVIGIERVYAQQFSPGEVEGALSFTRRLFAPFIHSPTAASLGLVAAAVGFAAAYRLYAGATADPLPEKLGAVARAMRNR